MGVLAEKGSGSMKRCLCNIFDTREERLVEADGRVIRRLICNICGCVLDSKEVKAPVPEKAGDRHPGEEGSEAVSM